MRTGTVLVLRSPPDDPDYIYSKVEVVGAHHIMVNRTNEVELVCAPLVGFGPNFLLPEWSIYSAGYEPSEAESIALERRRAEAAAAIAAARLAALPTLPWDLESA